MPEQDQLTIDEAVSTLANLEREERKRWSAIARLRGVFSIAQSLRDAEDKLTKQSEDYKRAYDLAAKEAEQRLSDLARHRADEEQTYARLTAEYEAKCRDAERQHAAMVAAVEAKARQQSEGIAKELRAVEQDRQAKLAAWKAEEAAWVQAHETLREQLEAEEASLQERVSYLKGELARIQSIMSGALGGKPHA